MRYRKDDGTLRKVLDEVLSKYKKTFKHLQGCNILLVWFEGSKKDSETLGRTRLAGKQVKDLFGYDVIIEINADRWKELSKRQKRKLMFHELCHIGVREKKDGELKYVLLKHDFELKRFRKELEVFGLDGDEEECLTFLSLVRKRKKRK